MYIFWIQGLAFLLAQVDVFFTATFDEEKVRIFSSKKGILDFNKTKGTLVHKRG